MEKRYLLKGSKHQYCLGQVVKIQVLGSDIDNRKVTFKILDDGEDLEVENE